LEPWLFFIFEINWSLPHLLGLNIGLQPITAVLLRVSPILGVHAAKLVQRLLGRAGGWIWAYCINRSEYEH
jgi:hypothetical protein